MVLSGFHIIAAIVFLTPAALAYALPTSKAKSFLSAIGIMMLVFLGFCFFSCLIVEFNTLLSCTAYASLFFFGIPYLVTVVFGSAFGLLIRDIFK